MLSKVIELWSKISGNGINDALDFDEKKRIRILNKVMFINVALAIIFSSLDAANLQIEGALVSLSPITLSVVFWLLIKRGFFAAAKWVTLIFIITFISSISIGFGSKSGIIVYFIPGALCPMLLFKKKLLSLTLSLLVILVMVGVYFAGQNYGPYYWIADSELVYYELTSLAGGVCLTILILWHFISTNIAYEQVILTKNTVLKETNQLIEKQKLALENNNERFTDSMEYARKIQRAMLPGEQLLESGFASSFAFLLPKDIVSGDFFWAQSVGDKILFAVADCTGHGVPGAMVSVLCSRVLNKVVLEERIVEPSSILNRSRELVIESFGSSEKLVYDGMDISLCVYNFKTNQLDWAGANNPLWIIRSENDAVEVLEPNRQPIGNYGVIETFTQHRVEVKKGDAVYLFSDGFADQFGGERNKKYTVAAFQNYLISIGNEEMREQKGLLMSEFERWRGDEDQQDDVCILGVRF